jgi:hypothetical protein
VKIKVTMTIEIDPQDWMVTFGKERHEVREDVKSYIAAAIPESGAFGSGEIEVKSFTWR